MSADDIARPPRPPKTAMPPSLPFRMPRPPAGGGAMPAPPSSGRSGVPSELKTRFKLEGIDKGGWHSNWYAICSTGDLVPGQLKALTLFGRRIVGTRTDNGEARFYTGYCRHIGADLAFGGVIRAGQIVCPFHHWKYDAATGEGTMTGLNQPVPKGKSLFAFPTRERWGLVWIFNGSEPTYDVPGFHGVDNDDDIELEVMQMPSQATQEVWVPFSNSNDFVHLRFLHRVTNFDGPNNYFIGSHGTGHDIGFQMPNGRYYDHYVRTHGTNCISFAVEVDKSGEQFMNMFTSVLVDDGQLITTMITGARKSLGPDKIKALMSESREYGMTLASEDNPVINNAWFGPDGLMDADHELAAYFDYVKSYALHDPFKGCRH
jgi:nitrite reductase/ring-hydroxylating ferredoxin subunit